MWSARQTRKMGRRVAGLLGGLLVGLLLAAAPAAAAFVDPPINVSNSASIPSERPAIAVNGAGQVFVVWKEGAEIFFTRTQGSCGGLKFEAPVSLSAGTGTASKPAVAANDSGAVFVAWQAASAVWFRRSTDDGQSFSPAVNLSTSVGLANSPSVAADNAGGVFVAWSGGSFLAEIFLARSTDLGANFGPGAPANVSGTSFTNSRAPSVAADGSNVYLAWEDGNFPFGVLSILYRTFGRLADLTTVAAAASANLSTGLGNAFSPNLAFGDRILSVVFGTFNGPSFYHRSSSDGTTFSAPENVSGTMQSLSPSDARAARRNGSAMVAWAKKLGLTDADTEIQYWLGGATAEQGSVYPTPGAKSVNPAAAMDSTGRLLVAWQETVNGSDEIYLSYRGGTSGVPATVWTAPRVVNFRTMGPGQQPNFTVFIELPDGSAGDIDLGSVEMNGYRALPAPSALGDANGNGIPDLMVKFNRSALYPGAGVAATSQPEGSFTVKGNTKSGGCFSAKGAVQIMR